MARPLPECKLCDMPTARAVWLRNGGLCSSCDQGVAGVAATVRMPRLPPAPDEFLSDATVLVEGYTPPVPGQLAIDDPTP
jgi:hypothetical protein